MESFAKNYRSGASYEVEIESDGIACVHHYNCGNHDEAVKMLITDHVQVGDPLPFGTSMWVVGPCNFIDCNCGKTRVRQYITCSSSNARAA